MHKTILKLSMGVVLLFASQACIPPGETTPDPNAINTAIAGTMAAALTQTAQPGIPITGPESPTPASTATPTQVSSPTPFATFTPVVTVPQISVSVPTNCRVGPGVAYDRIGALLAGEVAEVVGRAAARDYWIIRNPDRAGTCWLWGEYATVTGVTGVLPVFTPPPTPTPLPTSTPSLTPMPTTSFTASYSNLESCTGWWVDVQLRNNGGITFQSISMIVRDTTTDTVLSLYADSFTDRTGCSETNTWDTIPTGAARIVSSPAFTSDPTGHEIQATITLCSNSGQSGRCTTQTINFTP
jgi:hypothetical protein